MALPVDAQRLCFQKLVLQPVGFLPLNAQYDLLGQLTRAASLSQNAFQTHTDEGRFLLTPSVKGGTC